MEQTATPKVTAYYERKVNLGNYEHEVFGAYSTIVLPAGATDVDRLQALDQAGIEVRAAVAGQIDAGNGMQAAPVQPAPAAQPAPAPVAAAAPVAPAPVAAAPAVPQPVAAAFPGAVAVPPVHTAEHVQYLLDTGDTGTLNEVYYDNRADLAEHPTRPHFKDKATRGNALTLWPIKGSNPVRYA